MNTTQELIAHAGRVPVRWNRGCTETADAGLIRDSRGHIGGLDRPGLEMRVCECYGGMKREFDRLLGSA